MNEKRAHCSSCTENILQFWQDRWTLAAKPCAFDMAKVEMFNSVAEYYELRLTATDGAALRARYICPVKGETVPTVLMFHDYGRGIRGWHHMTRYAALGFAVLALENRMLRFDVTSGWENGPEGLLAVTLFTDALTLARTALRLPRTDPKRLVAWGEGFGGGLAIAAAAMASCEKCAVLNPMPADFRAVWRADGHEGVYGGIRAYFRDRDPLHRDEEALFHVLDYVDCVNLIPLVQGELLLGTGLLDTVSPPESQHTLYGRASCEKRQIVYPKYGHERINFFENEQLKFLLRT